MTRFEQSIFIITTLNGKIPWIRLVTWLILVSHLLLKRHVHAPKRSREVLKLHIEYHIFIQFVGKYKPELTTHEDYLIEHETLFPWGWGVSLYNGLYGKAPPERALFLGLQVYERVGISLVELHEMEGKSVISVFRKAKGANRCNSWPWKSRENFVFWQSSDRKKKCPY